MMFNDSTTQLKLPSLKHQGLPLGVAHARPCSHIPLARLVDCFHLVLRCLKKGMPLVIPEVPCQIVLPCDPEVG